MRPYDVDTVDGACQLQSDWVGEAGHHSLYLDDDHIEIAAPKGAATIRIPVSQFRPLVDWFMKDQKEFEPDG